MPKKNNSVTRYWRKKESLEICDLKGIRGDPRLISRFVERIAQDTVGECGVYFYLDDGEHLPKKLPYRWQIHTSKKFMRKLRWPNKSVDWIGLLSPDPTGLADILERRWTISNTEEIIVLVRISGSLVDFEEHYVDDAPSGPNEVSAANVGELVITRGADLESIRILRKISNEREIEYIRLVTNRILMEFGETDVSDLLL